MAEKVSHETRPPMSPAAADLFDAVNAMVRASVRRSPHAHVHTCQLCPDFYVCRREMDHCDVMSPWICGACLDEVQS